MDTFSYNFDVSRTLNNKVNFEKLHLELDASELPDYVSVKMHDGRIQVTTGSDLTPAQIDNGVNTPAGLLQTIEAHDGESAKTNAADVSAREEIVRSITEMAMIHPDLVSNDAVEYLTSIDNYLNAWIRSGENSVLHAKVMTDKDNVSHPQNTFLNTVIVTTGANAGTTTWMFLIAKTS